MIRYFLYMMIACFLILSACRKVQDKQFIERITLKKKDKIPYGTSAARQLLPSLFPGTSFYNDDSEPGNWESLNTSSSNQAILIMAIDFNADDEELRRLNYFAGNGNYVYIIAKSFSDEAAKFFNFSYSGNSFEIYSNQLADSLFLKFEQPAFYNTQNYTYPGKKFASKFTSINSNFTAVLGRDKDNNPNFIEYKTGTGRIFIHSSPLAFSNYFVLHKKNAEYFEHALSIIPRGIESFVWNEYYLSGAAANKRNKEEETAWYRVLFRYPAFKFGLLTGLFMLILYALLSSRRKQRKIPFHSKPQNDSLDFVKTLGRLYHDRRDHQNLAKKMTLYFLEHVRSTFKLPTHTLDENFIRALQYKSGFPQEELSEIFSFINYIKQDGQVNEYQLSKYHKQLETFYQTT
ncbi:MAG: hypothetical protein ACXWV9_05165 [Flavisolibacter sp.]